MKLDRLISALLETENDSADDLLLEALRIGAPKEQAVAIEILLRRNRSHGLIGIIARFHELPPPLTGDIIARARLYYIALGEAGRSDDDQTRINAMTIIARAQLGKLAYVLSENLRSENDILSRAACDALVTMAKWVSSESRLLHRMAAVSDHGLELLPHSDNAGGADTAVGVSVVSPDLAGAYSHIMAERPEIESAIARAMDVTRTRHAQEILRAALLLCDHPMSKTLAIPKQSKHGGQQQMVRKLQQPPGADYVEAFLLGASHGHLRTHFGMAFSQITEAPVLDALLRRSHWLKDHQLQLCMRQVSKGIWWSETDLPIDISHRAPDDVAAVGEWLAVSGIHESLQDAKFEVLHSQLQNAPAARLRLMRLVSRRPKSTPVDLVRKMVNDPDERLSRIAIRELVRRRPADLENVLLQKMSSSPTMTRRLIARAVGQSGFEQFFNRFEKLPREARAQAGRAMLKLLPDAITRLGRKLKSSVIDQRVRAMQIIQELGLAANFRAILRSMCAHESGRVRSKAVALLVEVTEEPTGPLLDRALSDADARVRANAIEVLESRRATEYVPLLTERARSTSNRERANAIKALHRMRINVATEHLATMLRDQRPEHRISAIWTLRHIGLWPLIGEVGRIAQADENLRVRRYAVEVIKSVMDIIRKNGPAMKDAKVA